MDATKYFCVEISETMDDYIKRRLTISHKLVKLREEKNFSQKELAGKLNISQSKLSKIENGIGKIDFLILEDICEHYGINISEFRTK